MFRISRTARRERTALTRIGERGLHRVLAVALVVFGVAASPALADAPANDARAAATALSPPAGVTGTTAGSTLEVQEAATVNGASVTGSVWYTFRTSQARRVVLRLAAAGDLDAGVELYRRARSQLPLEQSQLTGENGRADIIFDSRAGATYLVRVAQRENSVPGGFRLDVYLPRLFPSAPGARLPKAGVAGRVDGLANAADAYSTVLRAGITYRINLANLSSHRLVLSVFGPGVSSFQSDEPIRSGRSYVLITPGVDEGGRYSFVVSASRVTSRQSYRLQVGRAGLDDQFPGKVLPEPAARARHAQCTGARRRRRLPLRHRPPVDRRDHAVDGVGERRRPSSSGRPAAGAWAAMPEAARRRCDGRCSPGATRCRCALAVPPVAATDCCGSRGRSPASASVAGEPSRSGRR